MNSFLQSLKTRKNLIVAAFIAVFSIGSGHSSQAQIQATMAVRGDINTFGNSAMTYRSSLAQTWIATVQATATNGAAAFLFANNGSFSPKWANGGAVSFNTKSMWFASGADGTYNQTNGNFYTFICQDQNGGTNSQGYVFQTTATPVSVSTVTQSVLASSVTVGQAVTITATTSASLPAGQGVFLRYSTNAFSTSTVVNMTGSGSTYTASIPGTTNTAGANVVYYVFTSGGITPPAAADCDLATININNNSGSNYSYTVATPAAIYIHAFEGATATPYVAVPGTLNANLSGSSWANSSGTFGAFGGNTGNSLSLNSVTGTQTYTLSLNVAAGFGAAVTSFSLWSRASATGPTNWSMTINGISAGSGTINSGGGAISTVSPVTNVVAGLTGTLTAIITLTGGTGGSFRLDDFTLNGNVVAVPSPPVLTTPTATVTSPTAATLGANITSNGGSAITARGTSWKSTSPVVATDNQLAEGGTATGVYTQARTGFSAQTQYFYVGYATNANGTAISSEGNFRTWSNPPTAQPTGGSFTTTAGSSSLTANWGNATYPGSGATQGGYVVIYSTGTPTLSSANGVAPAAGVGTLVNITPTVLPATPALTTTITGLVNGTLYNLLIVPYTWDGSNAATYNYLTSGALTTTGTPVASSYTWNGGATGTWSNSANWTPTGIPSGGDLVTFSTPAAISVTTVPTVTLGRLTVNTGVATTLNTAAGANITVTLSNSGTALSVPSGATLNINANTTGSFNLAYSGTGNTATIAGVLNLNVGSTGGANYNATNSATTVTGWLSTNSSNNTITSTTSNLTIGAGGRMMLTGATANSVPAATYNSTSTLKLSHTGSGTINLSGVNGATYGNVLVDSTLTGSIVLNSGASVVSFTVAGNFTHTGAQQVNMASSSATTNLSVAGNFQKTAGTLNTSGSASNGTITFTGAAASLQCNSSQWTNFVVAASAVCTLNGAFVTNSNSSATNPTSFTVNANGTLNCSTFVLSGSTTASSNSFILVAGGTLGIGSPVGITTTGNATGNIQTVIRTFPAGGNYTYNGTNNQTATGNALPVSLTGILRIDNTGTSPNNVVTLSQATTTTGTLSLINGSLDLNALTLTLSSNAAQSIAGSGSNTFNITGAANSTLALSSGGTSRVVTLSNFGTAASANLITGANVNVQLNSNTQLDCAGNGTTTSMLTVLGRFTLASGTASNIANIHPPFYGTGSTLVYGASYGRFSEWNTTSGPGYPFNVTVSAGTLNVVNTVNTFKRAAGTLTVSSGAVFSVADLTTGNGSGIGVEFLGDIVNDGTISLNTGGNTTSQRLKAANLTNGNSNATASVNLSGAGGGDLELTGNYVDNAVFNANARAVFFTGTGTQTIGGTATAPFNIDYVVVTKASGSVQLLTDLLTEGPNGGNAITLSSATDIFDLNGRILTLGKAGVASTISGAGVFKGSSASSLTILGTGAFGTIRFDQTTNPQTNGVGSLTIDRTSTGSVILGSTFNAITSATFTNGVLDVNGNTFRMGGTVSRTSGTLTVVTGTTTFNGTSAQNIPVSLYTSNTASNIVISNAAGVTFNGSVAVSTQLTVNANSLFIPISTAVISGAGTLVGASNTTSVAQVTRTTGVAHLSNQYTLNRTLTNLIIEYAGGAAQDVTGITFGGLKISNGNGVNMSGTVTVNAGLNLNTGNLSIGANTLTLNGAVTRTSGNLAGGNTSNLIIGGAAGSLFFDAAGTNNYLKDFTINNAASATLGSALNITAGASAGNEGTLTVSGTGVLTTGNLLAIKSDINGTARIAANTSGGTYISGDVSVERYIRQNSSKGWRLLASNTSGQTIKDAWQEGQSNSMNDPNPGFGTKISAGSAITTNLTTARATLGFDTLSAGVSLFKYNPATDGLEFVPNTNTTSIASEPGYFIFIRGDRSPGQFGAGAPTTATVLRSKGSVFQGSQTTTTGAQNYGLGRNPYASRIDMRNITVQSNVVDAFQVWDAKIGGAFGVGGYQTFSKSGADYIVTPGGGSYGANGSVQNFIESGAAFFINSVSNVSNNSVIIPEIAKTSASSNALFRPATPAAGESRISFNLYANNTGNYDIVDGGLVFFNNVYSNDVTVEDVRKNSNFNENFGMVRSNVQLVIEKRQQTNVDDTIFFSMNQLRQIQYKLDIEAMNIDPLITTAILQDRYTSTSTAINLSTTNSYNFTVDANAASKAADRFRLVFRQTVVVPVSFISVRAAQSGRNISVEWNVANEINTVRYEVEKSADGRNFVAKGNVAASGKNTYNWLDENVVAGFNYYRIKSLDNNGAVKYTQVVKVQVGGKAGITVSPNPVQGNFVNIHFANEQAGKYGIQITNIAGQAVYNKEVTHNGGSASQSFILPSSIVSGIYQLQVIAPDNTKHTEKLIINQGN
jgi:hypothetical protein